MPRCQRQTVRVFAMPLPARPPEFRMRAGCRHLAAPSLPWSCRAGDAAAESYVMLQASLLLYRDARERGGDSEAATL